MNEIVQILTTRRSSKPALLGAPGPAGGEIDTILTCAARVPDHKAVAPWRFVVLEGDARRRFGERVAEVLKAEEKEPPSEVRLETERGRFAQAPVVIVVVNHVKPTPGAPEFEQVLSCGAAAMNLCHAANALGYQTAWVTGWAAFSPGVAKVLGLGEGERVAGFVHIGTAKERQADRERPALASVVTRWTS